MYGYIIERFYQIFIWLVDWFDIWRILLRNVMLYEYYMFYKLYYYVILYCILRGYFWIRPPRVSRVYIIISIDFGWVAGQPEIRDSSDTWREFHHSNFVSQQQKIKIILRGNIITCKYTRTRGRSTYLWHLYWIWNSQISLHSIFN